MSDSYDPAKILHAKMVAANEAVDRAVSEYQNAALGVETSDSPAANKRLADAVVGMKAAEAERERLAAAMVAARKEADERAKAAASEKLLARWQEVDAELAKRAELGDAIELHLSNLMDAVAQFHASNSAVISICADGDRHTRIKLDHDAALTRPANVDVLVRMALFRAGHKWAMPGLAIDPAHVASFGAKVRQANRELLRGRPATA